MKKWFLRRGTQGFLRALAGLARLRGGARRPAERIIEALGSTMARVAGIAPDSDPAALGATWQRAFPSKKQVPIVAATDGRRIAALLDSVGGPIVPKLFDTLLAGARIIAYGVQEREPAAVTNAMLIYSNLIWKGFGIDRWLSQLTVQAAVAMREELWSMIRSGVLKLPVASIHRLDSIGDALAANAQRKREGKVLLI